MTDLEKSIIKTVFYYGALGGLPLTPAEIFRYLQKEAPGETPPKFSAVLKLLDASPVLREYLDQKHGFFFKKNSSDFYWQRIERQKIAAAKWRKIKRIAVYLSLAPFLRGLLVSGSLALNNTRADSDLDFLVIAKKNRIWTCRMILSFLLQIIGQRRHDKIIADKICLNHYLAGDSLRINLRNLSNAHTDARLIPLTGGDACRLFVKTNRWINDFLFFQPREKNSHKRRVNEQTLFFKTGRALAVFFEFIINKTAGNRLEKNLERWQTDRIKKKVANKKLKENELFLSPGALLFHYPVSRNAQVMERYGRMTEKIG